MKEGKDQESIQSKYEKGQRSGINTIKHYA